VTSNSPATAPIVRELDELLLDAKVSIPRPRRGAVSRSELIDVARASDCRVIGITAPPGYGKSTLLVQWANAEDRQVGWVSLDRLDDDPGVLLTLLASAFVKASSSNQELIADVSGVGISILGRAAPRFTSVLRTSPIPFVLMLDDVHELQSSACHDVLSMVISAIPPGSQLVATSRFEQPDMPRLRASGDALEFVASDLALGATGAQQIFSEAKVSLTMEQAAELTDRTEGWPVGLYLAALIAREDSGDHKLEVSGEDRYVADYLYRESLSRLPEATQHFLRSTAVPDRFTASLCDALLEEHGAQEQLHALEGASMFLIPLDRRRDWYRYHSLFREFLLGELRRVEPEALTKLHLRAADWYESNGHPAMAVEHLLSTTERERCIHLVAKLTLSTYQAGQMSTVLRWLATLGDAAIESYPPLAVLAGWMATLSGHTQEAERWAAFIDSATFDGTPVDGTASFESSRAMLRGFMCPVDPEQMASDATLAVAQEPAWSRWRDIALGLLGEAHLLDGEDDKAASVFTESSSLREAETGNADSLVLSESELALLAMHDGRWSEAAKHLQLALDTVDEHRMHDYPPSLLAFAAAARLSVHRGDLADANRRLTQAMRARQYCTFVLPFVAVRVRLQLAQVYLALADRTTARHLLREIDDILLRRPNLGLLVDQVEKFRLILTSSTEIGATGASPLSPAELRLLPYLQTHLTIREIGERLFVSRNTVSSEVASIYRKLAVSSRSEAVEQATMIGLLGG
jgi:LuxR family transcriptional regulator, maltose regulon positive regulatory protein